MITPQKLAEILATLPSWLQMRPLDTDQLERYLRDNYLRNKEEKARREQHQRRQEIYQDGGLRYIDALIDEVYAKISIKERIKAWARVARFDNPLKRIVNELSTVYQKPATRTVAGEANNETYRKVQKLCRQAERFRQVNRLLNLHRSLFVGFRLRQFDKKPAIDIVTPDQCFAVTHPNDPTVLVALIISTKPRPAATPRLMPAFNVWTHREFFQLTGDGVVIQSSYREHGFERMPWVHVSLEPGLASFWPGDTGEDLVGASLSAWFANANLLKETKSATKFPVVMGDTSSSARGQAADADEVVELQEGTAIQSIDNTMDLDLFMGTADHALEHAARNYGISPGLLKHEGVQSAEARELQRAPLKELREEQLVPITEFEEEFAQVQAMVCAVKFDGYDGDLAFTVDDWSIRYGEVRTPLSAKERLEIFEQERRLGLTNTVAYLMERYGVTEDQAWKLIEENVDVELIRNVMMRPLQEVSGSPGAELSATPGDQPIDKRGAQPEQGEEKAA